MSEWDFTWGLTGKELEEAHLIRRRSQCQFSTPRIYIPTNHPDEA